MAKNMTGSTTTLETQGRIPIPRVASPISTERFDALAKYWRPFGIWLSLWDREGVLECCDEDGPRLWTTFWARRGAFAKALSQHAIECMDGMPRADGQTPALQLGPWQPDLGIIAIPVMRRTRVIGAILGGFVGSDLSGEAIGRLCDQCGLDHQAMRSIGAEVRKISGDSIAPTAGLLALTVNQARDLDVEREESGVLTHNLESTYEELNLIYRISAQMSLPQRPQDMLEKVGIQVTEISRASTIAFVLTEQESSDSRNVPGILKTSRIEDRVVTTGRRIESKIDLIRLAESLNLDPVRTPSQLLFNNTPQRSEFSWASGWLQHLVALPLWHKQKLLGVMLAINCNDGGDFTSVDVQLVRAVADRVSAFLENQRLYDDLADLLMGLLHAVVNSVDAKDPYTYGHSERVAFLSRALARASGLSPTECERVYLAGLLHDVGKIGVPDAILCKPGKLTLEEFEVLKKHPEIGVRILSPVRQTRDLLPGVLYHHERMDGRGYPEGITGKSIPLLGRIICLADCFDAMTTNRTYRAALPLETAISEVRRCAGTQFDPHLAELFLDLDLENLFQQVRVRSVRDAEMSHLGALHAVLGEQVTNQEASCVDQGC